LLLLLYFIKTNLELPVLNLTGATVFLQASIA
jgi:hypothetical protein